MRIGINASLPHETPEQWAEDLQKIGFRAASFPVDYTATDALIEAYVKAAKERDIVIAEVGVWDSPFLTDPAAAKRGAERCLRQFELAEYIGARTCVNVAGAAGEVWNAIYPENYGDEMYKRIVEFMQMLCDKVNPKRTTYSLESMQWMVPDSPEQYLQVLKDVNREGFSVHLDAVNFIKDPYTYTHMTEVVDRSIDLLGDRMTSCHLKDCFLPVGLTVMISEVLPGTGAFPIRHYLDRLSTLDPDLPVLLEHLPDRESYVQAFANVQKILAE